MALQSPAQDAWTRARDRFVEDLSETEKQMYYKGSLEMIYYDASAAKHRHESVSSSKHLVDKLQPLVSAIDQYAEALDVYSNTYPLALSPLWGSLRIVLHLAREFGKYFEKLLDMFEQIGQVLPRFRAYERLFPSNERLIQSISIVYVDVLAFCCDVKSQFRNGKRAARINLSILSKLVWKPIDVQFGNYMRKFKDHERNVEKEAKVSEMIESAESRALIQANRLQLEKEKQGNERQAILSKLCAVSSIDIHKKQRDLCYEGTGRWALQSPQYLSWKAQTGHRGLCCYGIPGCGKSVLASTMVEDLQTLEASGQHVLYYYCSHADARSVDINQILGGLLKQLILSGILSSNSQQEVLMLLGKNEDHDRKEKLAKILKATIISHPVAFLIVDGLDECKSETQKLVISFLNELVQIEASRIQVLVTCRDESQTLSIIQDWPSILLSESAINEDLRRFVSFSVRSCIERGDLNITDTSLEDEVITALTTKAHGMFLWVHFQLIELCSTVAASQIREVLEGLPDGLGDTYERILKRINAHDLHWKIAKRIFKWLACARRPLKLEEMQEAVAFDGTDKAWDPDKIPNRNSLLKICQGLVVQGPNNGVVQFAHHTIQQYLFKHNRPVDGNLAINRYRSNIEDYHKYINSISGDLTSQDDIHHHCLSMYEADEDAAELCITNLNFSDFETAITPHVQDTRFANSSILGPGGPGAIAGSLGLGKPVFNAIYRVMGRSSRPGALDIDYAKYLNLKPGSTIAPQDGKHAFLGYIVENWPWHIRCPSRISVSRFEDLLVNKILPFEFRPWGPNRHFGPYGCTFCSTTSVDELVPKYLILTSMIHWAATEGHSGLLEHIIDFKRPKNSAVLSALDVHLHHEKYSKETIRLACRMGHANIVQLLLSHCDICWDSSLFMIAASAGHVEVLETLRNVHVEEFDSQVDSLFFKAATNGHVPVVQYLLPCAMNLSFRDDITEMTAFQSAVVNGCEEVVRLLAHAGHDIDERDVSGATALHQTVRRGDLSMTICLVESGASIEVSDAQLKSPLDLAILAGHSSIIDFLLAQPACRTRLGNLNLLDEVHNTKIDWERPALRERIWAAAFGHRESLITVLDRIDSQTNDVGYDIGAGVSLIHIAARYNGTQAIEELLRRGLSPDTSTNDFCTPLHIAARWARGWTMKELLRLRAQPSCRTAHGWTPLHFAAQWGDLENIEELCGSGANVNAHTSPENGALTPLHVLVSDYHRHDINCISFLVNAGANLKQFNHNGQTIYEIAKRRTPNTAPALLRIEAQMKDRPQLWHLAGLIIKLGMLRTGLKYTTPVGVTASDFLNGSKLDDDEIVYAKELIKSARESAEKVDGDLNRRHEFELIAFLLEQTMTPGTARLQAIPSSDTPSDPHIMDDPPNTPVEEPEPSTAPYPAPSAWSFEKPRLAPTPRMRVSQSGSATPPSKPSVSPQESKR